MPPTTRGHKRACDEHQAESPPNQKVLRAVENGTVGSTPRTCGTQDVGSSEVDGIKAVLAQLKATVNALKKASPLLFDESDLDALCEAQGELEKVNDGVWAQHEAVRHPPPEETPLIFDDLVHALSFLTPQELGSAAQVSRHFRRAVESAVATRLDRLGGFYSCFELAHGVTSGVPLLVRLEREFMRLPELIAKIKSGGSSSEVNGVLEEVKEMDHNVKFLHSDLLWAKLDDLEQEDTDDTVRAHLLSLLHDAKIPEDWLADYVGYPMYELDMREDCNSFNALCALFLMDDMPSSVIETHVDTLLWWVMSDHSSGVCSQAFRVIKKLGPKKLASLKLAGKIASAPLATSKNRCQREEVANLVARIRELE